MSSATCCTDNPVRDAATSCSAAKPLASVCDPGAPFGAALLLASLADAAMAGPFLDIQHSREGCSDYSAHGCAINEQSAYKLRESHSRGQERVTSGGVRERLERSSGRPVLAGLPRRRRSADPLSARR